MSAISRISDVLIQSFINTLFGLHKNDKKEIDNSVCHKEIKQSNELFYYLLDSHNNNDRIYFIGNSVRHKHSLII